ncbi:hypothetical protein, partial [Wolbachia pipientis]|uniref:hypothetical protein n=1 Tax=Wolbachia pipientis TaxID=955 RepID=UPI001C9DA004
AHYYSATYSNIESKLAPRGFFCLFFRLVNFLMFVAKRQPSSCYVLAAKRYRGGMTRENSCHLLAPRWYDNKLVIPQRDLLLAPRPV